MRRRTTKNKPVDTSDTVIDVRTSTPVATSQLGCDLPHYHAYRYAHSTDATAWRPSASSLNYESIYNRDRVARSYNPFDQDRAINSGVSFMHFCQRAQNIGVVRATRRVH